MLAGPFFVAGGIPLLLRAVLIGLAALLGVLITLETDGMPSSCQRLLWRARGQVRLLLRGRALTPDDLPGTRAAIYGHRAVSRNGAVRKSLRQRPATTATLPARPWPAPGHRRADAPGETPCADCSARELSD